MKALKRIVVYEHQSLRLNQHKDFDLNTLEALQAYYGSGNRDFFSLEHKGVRFNEHVGALQAGNVLIEVLPKADRIQKEANPKAEQEKWRSLLIGMLRSVGQFTVKATSESSLRIRRNSILDLYFEEFLNELEYLLRRGIIKQYRTIEGNRTSLKGKLKFNKHIQKNLIHKERFFIEYSTYDSVHLIHMILYKALRLLKRINVIPQLHSRIGALLLHFPEMPDINVNEILFRKIAYNRKNNMYERAIRISEMLLLKYHPDIMQGSKHVLALMFNMNQLWEEFVFKSLRKSKNLHVKKQVSKSFWKHDFGGTIRVRPDILIDDGHGKLSILDTKWKSTLDNRPTVEDLRQMYVYLKYFSSTRAALVYPGQNKVLEQGTFYPTEHSGTEDGKCSIIKFPVNSDIGKWQREISGFIGEWAG